MRAGDYGDRFAKVYLDDQEVQSCLMADEENGLVELYHPSGMFTVEVHGQVRIEVPESIRRHYESIRR
jgi:hypothetical protein